MCIILACLGYQNAKAQTQDIKREGNVFIASPKLSSDDILTTYKWRDNKGVEYPIFIHLFTKGEKQGHYTCYVIRKSSKTEKEYKYFIPNGETIANAILSEMNSSE